MGSCCTKPPEPPPGANMQVVVGNAAFDSARAATPRCDRCKAKIQFCVCNVGEATLETTSSSPRKLQGVRGKATVASVKVDSGTKQPANGQEQAQQQQQQPHDYGDVDAPPPRPPASRAAPPLPPPADESAYGEDESPYGDDDAPPLRPPPAAAQDTAYGEDDDDYGGATEENILKKKKNHQSQQPPPLPPARAATDCDRCKSKAQFCNCDADSSRPAPQQQAVPRVQRIVLSSNDLALKCAGLGLDDGHASYVNNGAAKVKKAIVKLREGKTATAAALAAFKKTQHVPQELLELAQGEVLRAIGVTRLGVLNAEGQWKEQGKRDGSRDGEAVIEDRQTLLAALRMQIEFASKLGITTLVEKDAELNAAVDAAASASAAGSFDTTVEIATDTGLDMRLVAGVLALREVLSEVAKKAVYFDAGKFDPYAGGDPPDGTDAWYLQDLLTCSRLNSSSNPDFAIFKKRLELLHATATAPQDKAAVAATNALFRIFPGFSTAKLDAMARLVPAILKDVAIYNEIFNAIISSTPQAVFDELKSLAATPSQLPDWESRLKNHPGDPAPDSLEYLMVARHRAADDSITFYTSVHTILTAKLPAGCQAAAMPGLVKAEQRIIFKTASSYSGEGCFGRCNDIVRLTVRVETMEELLMVLKSFLGSEDILVLRQKHRLDPDKDMSMIGGYRDYQLLVAFKRDAASVATDGGPEYAVGEIQINLANFIDIKEGVAAGGGGGHGPYKLARSFNGYSPETVAYAGAPSMALVKKIEGGMLLSVTIAGGSESAVDNLEDAGKAMAEALLKPTCRVQELDFGGGGWDATPNPKLIAQLLPILPSVVGLTRLNMAGYEGVALPGSLQGLVNLEELTLEGCSKFKQLPQSVAKLTKLKTLNLIFCKTLETLPETGVAGLVNLEVLNLSRCTELKQLPQSIAKLAKLKTLNLGSCETLETLPETGVAGLGNLEVLDLNSCKKLKQLPQSIATLAKLKTLNLQRCKNLAEPLLDLSHLLPGLKINVYDASDAAKAWEKRGFTSLAKTMKMIADGTYTDDVLHLSGYDSEKLPDSVWKLTHLKTLNLEDCKTLKTLPQKGVAGLVNLEELDLWGCKKLKQLPRSIAKLTKLKTLKLYECNNLETLPETGVAGLVNLEELNLTSCSKLKQLPQSIAKLTKLKTLKLYECNNLETLPETGVAGLGNLEVLNLSRCTELKQLPQSIAKLAKLKTLNLQWCKNLETLPETGVAGLVNLEELNLGYCTKLKQLPKSIAKLTKLKTLSVGFCNNLAEPLPDLSHLLPGLKIGVYAASDAAQAWKKRGFTSLAN